MLKNYINGLWVDSVSNQKQEIINPATKEILGYCPLGSDDDVKHAVAAAKSAFVSWRQTPAQERVQYLFKMKQLLEQNFLEIAQTITKENGKTLVEAKGSVRRCIQMVETACGIQSMMMGESFEDIATGIDCISIKRPMGVFAAITPFNFPAMVAFWFWPFAVATGNTFLIKPSERVPLTQKLIFELIDMCKFPKGVINLVNGSKQVVNSILNHPDICGISFVGSTPVAKYIYEQGCKNSKRVQALGGAKNVMVVLPDAVVENSAKTALESIIGCAGERCLAGSVVLCIGSETYEKIKTSIIKHAREIVVGNGLDETTQMGPVITQESKTRIQNLIQNALNQGAQMLLDGRENVDHLPGYFLKPTVLGNIQFEMEIAREEVFGPVVLLGCVDSLDDAIKWINKSDYANTTTLFTTSGAAARKFMYEVDPSMIGINIGVPAPMAYFTFGGTKNSFFGDLKAHGKSSIEFFTDTKTSTLRWFKDGSIW